MKKFEGCTAIGLCICALACQRFGKNSWPCSHKTSCGKATRPLRRIHADGRMVRSGPRTFVLLTITVEFCFRCTFMMTCRILFSKVQILFFSYY
ncbi:hypothetical protein HanIR_Chr11g0557021 [Helianthus annuus]|nr:hypothetical protein HanIR_Chr11g0557021 [Helianthus annuus]